jgi:hypothetical protein
MKRLCWVVGVVLALVLEGGTARAEDQPWWEIFTNRNKAQSPEEERLQRFWHDYYGALQRYYSNLDRVSWVAYYKNHGYQINAGCSGPGCCQRIQFAPVFVSPQMQWVVPTKPLTVPSSSGK